jgi:selenide,water dikinase
MKDLAKRRRVMQRSMRLGHCVCDPKKPCPCDLLRTRDICLCAGERMPVPDAPVRLTRLVEHAGCASKIDMAALKQALGGLVFPTDPRVLVGAAAGDDAGVYQLDEHTALVQTVDVFTPSVDDPYTFGQVAAANSVSDIYAMGGRPLTALSVIGFPIRTVPDRALREILRGGVEKMAEAGVAVIGGHSINDPEIKAGFAVTGVIDPRRVTLRAGARPGDVLVLTKPLGTGILAFASQIDLAPPGAMDAAARSMATLNKAAAEAMITAGAHGCTDVTGFGLMGHLSEMAAGSGVDMEIVWDDLPLFDGVLECVGKGVLPGAMERNREACGEAVVMGEGVSSTMVDVCMDAQTSGGLLIAIAEKDAAALVARLRGDGVAAACVIGRVRGKGAGRVFLETRGTRPIPEATYGGGAGAMVPGRDSLPRAGSPDPARPVGSTLEENTMSNEHEESCCSGGSADEPCCSGGSADEPCCSGGKSDESCCCGSEAAAATGVADTQAKFKAFMAASGRPGALDVATKQAVAIALSVYARCDPCVRAHIRKARQMGFTQEEIDEAAWMGIAFGGSPVMMFYEGVRNA